MNEISKPQSNRNVKHARVVWGCAVMLDSIMLWWEEDKKTVRDNGKKGGREKGRIKMISQQSKKKIKKRQVWNSDCGLTGHMATIKYRLSYSYLSCTMECTVWCRLLTKQHDDVVPKGFPSLRFTHSSIWFPTFGAFKVLKKLKSNLKLTVNTNWYPLLFGGDPGFPGYPVCECGFQLWQVHCHTRRRLSEETMHLGESALQHGWPC